MNGINSGPLQWEVELPPRGATPIGRRRPQGSLIIRGPEGEERKALPLAVARSLAGKKKRGEVSAATRAELAHLVGELCQSGAKTRIERLIDRREYSSDEVRKKLRQDGYPEHVIEPAVIRACEVGLISDLRFAENFIRSKLYAGWGEVRIKRELAQRGIDADELPGWPYEYFDPADEAARAYELARRHLRPGKNAYQRLVRYLCGRGFSLSVATQASSRVLNEEEMLEF